MQTQEAGDGSFKYPQVIIDIEAVERMLREDAAKAKKKPIEEKPVEEKPVVIDCVAVERMLQAIGK